jgi:hypothetical protein
MLAEISGFNFRHVLINGLFIGREKSGKLQQKNKDLNQEKRSKKG